MKMKVWTLVFLAGFGCPGWGGVLDPDSVRFEQGDLCAQVRGEVADLPVSAAFLAPGQDPESVDWTSREIAVRDGMIRAALDNWFPERVPKRGVLLLRFGADEMTWGVSRIPLAAGEQWVGTWGALNARRVSFPDGVSWALPEGLCRPVQIVTEESAAGEAGLMVMPFSKGDACSVEISPDEEATPFCLPGLQAWSLEALALVEAGFTGGGNPVLSDWIWKLDPVTGEVDSIYWYRTSDQSWRSSAEGYPSAESPLFFPGEVVVIRPRVSPQPWMLRPAAR